MQTAQGDKAELLRAIRERKSELAGHYTVTRIGVFGSFARGTAGPESDVDVLVQFREPTFDHYMDLKFYLESLLGRPVDLVLYDAIKPRLKAIIEQEVMYA